MKVSLRAAVAALGLAALSATTQAQVGGNLVAPPPLDLELEITGTGPTGPTLSVTEIPLITGEYYRLNITSDGAEPWRFETPDLLLNSHVRVLTINDIEVHLQSMVFRAIEFDAAGTASFSFTPVRPGTYEFTVGDAPTAPPPAGAPDAQAAASARAVVGRFIVE